MCNETEVEGEGGRGYAYNAQAPPKLSFSKALACIALVCVLHMQTVHNLLPGEAQYGSPCLQAMCEVPKSESKRTVTTYSMLELQQQCHV